MSPRRLMEQGTPSMLESNLTSSVSASSGETSESTMGDVRCALRSRTAGGRRSRWTRERAIAKVTGEAQPRRATLCQRRVLASPSRRCCWQQERA